MTGSSPGGEPNDGRTAAWVLRYEACPVHPWRNGRGRVRRIAAGEGWQLSLADITDSGPFSDYAGHLRLFAMVEGVVDLEMPDGRRIRCDPDSPVAAFDGGAAPHCSLVTGPARALNLITRPDKVHAGLERRTIGPADTVALEAGAGLLAIHVGCGQIEGTRRKSGGWPSASDTESVAAGAGDTLMPPSGAGVLLQAGDGTAPAIVLIGRVEPLPEVSPPPGVPPTISTPVGG